MRLSSSSFLLNNGEYFKANFPSLSFSGIPTRDTSVLGISGIESQTPISEPPTAVLRGRRALYGGGQARCRLAGLNSASAIEPLDDELVAFRLV